MVYGFFELCVKDMRRICNNFSVLSVLLRPEAALSPEKILNSSNLG